MSDDVKKLRKLVILLHTVTDGLLEFFDLDDTAIPEDLDDELLVRMLEETHVKLSLSGEDILHEIEFTGFFEQAGQCDSMTPGNEVSLRTERLAIQLLAPVSEMAHAVVHLGESLRIQTESNVAVRLESQCLPVAVFALKSGSYGDFIGPVSSYPAVLVADFSNFLGDRTELIEKNIIDAYLFELAASHDVVFSKGRFIYQEDEPEWWSEDLPPFRLRELEDTNEGIRLFLAATQVQDLELRFFSFYKVLEHYGPTVLNLEAHESLRKKLDSPAALSPDGQFLREVLQLAKTFDQRKNDREMIKIVLSHGVDVVGLNSLIPESFRETVAYDSPARELEKYTRGLADKICATRNDVAHAKSTYLKDGTECPPEELESFTEFIRAAAAEVIRLYNRLPEHQRVDVLSG